MVEPSLASAFVMAEPNFLFQILKVALDAPAQLGGIDKVSESRVCRQRRKPEFGRSLLGFRPFHEQPFFRPWLGAPGIAMRRPDAHSRKARDKRAARSLPPANRLPRLARQSLGEVADLDRLLALAPQQLGRPSLAGPGFCGLRRRSRFPHSRRSLHANHISKAKLAQAGPERRVVAIT